MRTLSMFALLLAPCLLTAQDAPGKAVYAKYCDQCHGVNGDGQGFAASHVTPVPRDFTAGVFKFRSTGAQYLPTEDDLIEVVHDGIFGTSMPSFAHIGDQNIRDAVGYIQHFYQDRIDRDKEDGFYPPKPITVGNPPKVTDERIAKGKALYFSTGCGECHGMDGRADGPSSETLEDDNGNPIKAANLTKSWRFRAGNRLSDIYKAFSTGITGTPMPSFQETLSDKDRWDIAAYVKSLSPATEPDPSAMIVAANVNGALPEAFDDPAWDGATEAYFPLTAQIIWEPVNINPTVTGVRVKALHNGEELALLLQWDDPTFSLFEEAEESDDFFSDEVSTPILNDGFAVQFPSGEPKANERPYFVMGDSKASVNLWRWENGPNHESVAYEGDAPEDWQKYHTEYKATANLTNRVAKGREQVNELADAAPLNGELRYLNGTYSLLVKRSLAPNATEGTQLIPGRFTPIAFWAWDGHNEESGAKGSLTAWYLLVLAKPVETSVYYKTAGAVLLVLLLQWLAIRAARRKDTTAPAEVRSATPGESPA